MTGSPPTLEAEAVRLSDQEFERLRDLIYEDAGIHLGPAKKALVVSRLSRRLRALGLGSFDAYFRYVVGGSDPGERVRLLDCIATNETHFFREPRHFEFLEQSVYPAWREQAGAGRRARRVRVWSAGCSTGEEPYSIAMSLLHHFPPTSGFELEIIATDLSVRALERASSAIWPLEKTAEIPPHHLRDFMLRGVRGQQGRIRAGPELRALVRFERVNLHEDAYPIPGVFDLVFCRNVLIYFDAKSRTAVVDRLVDRLAPEGYLLVGHAETLNAITSRVRSVIPTVYAHAGPR